jgi:DNA-directed RNA polymerase specialized sigma24 family protein
VHDNLNSGYQAFGVGEIENPALPFKNRLYRTALILTGSPRFARNLLYDTFLKARHGHGRFHHDDDLGMWVFRILFGAFWSKRHGSDRERGDLHQNGGTSSDSMLAHFPKNTSPKYPFREMLLPPVCA